MYFCVKEFEVDVNDSIFSGNGQQKVYLVRSDDDFEIESKYNLNPCLPLLYNSYLGFTKCFFSKLFSSCTS